MLNILIVNENVIEIDINKTRRLFTQLRASSVAQRCNNIQEIIKLFECTHDKVLKTYDCIIYKIDVTHIVYNDIRYFNECKQIILGIQDRYSKYISRFVVMNSGFISRRLYNIISIFILQEMKYKIRFE